MSVEQTCSEPCEDKWDRALSGTSTGVMRWCVWAAAENITEIEKNRMNGNTVHEQF